MAERVSVRRELFIWARERSRLTDEYLAAKFPALDAWTNGDSKPTLKQLESFAQRTHTPIGYFFLAEPPQEPLPIPDFRTVGDIGIGRASPDLPDTVYQCQARQEWYRDYARLNGEQPVEFVGTMTTDTEIADAAARMSALLSFAPSERSATWSDAFRRLLDEADSHGVLAMVSGVVGSNTHRKLDADEFRGFALVDTLAPLVFINGADTKAAQIFTLAHELAHIWLDESAVSDAFVGSTPSNATERWCNQVAAEFIVPRADLMDMVFGQLPLEEALERTARRFKMSTLVALRRLRDVGYLTREQFRGYFADELARVRTIMEEREGGGGNFCNTQPVRVSKRFARALIASTLEGQTLRRDAFRMLGFKKVSTFQELGHRLGVM